MVIKRPAPVRSKTRSRAPVYKCRICPKRPELTKIGWQERRAIVIAETASGPQINTNNVTHQCPACRRYYGVVEEQGGRRRLITILGPETVVSGNRRVRVFHSVEGGKRNSRRST